MFDWYPDFEYALARTQLVCFMLGMGATLSLHEFVRVAKSPRTLVYGMVFQVVLVPLVAVVINHVAQLGAGIAVGLVLVSLMPGGTMSKVLTYVGRGNVALCITLSAFTTLAAVITVPLLLRVLAFGYVPEDFPMPVERIVADVLLYLLAPLLAGMSVARCTPRHKQLFARWCVRVGWVFVIVMVVGSLASGRINPADYGWRAPAAIIVFCLLTQQLSMVPFYLFRWPRPDRLAIGIEVTMRNMNLALLLKALLFPEDSPHREVAHGVLFVILFFAGVAMVTGVPLALNHLRLFRTEKGRPNPMPESLPARRVG